MFLISFKLTDIFSINKQTTIIIIIIQTQAKICFCFSKVHAKILLCSTNEIFNPIQDGLFRDCSRMGEGGRAFWPTLRKICHTNPTMMKLGTVIPYPRKFQKLHKSRDTSLGFCWHQHFFTGNQQMLLQQEIHIQIGFWYIISIFFNFSWVFSNCFKIHGYNFDNVIKNNYSRSS